MYVYRYVFFSPIHLVLTRKGRGKVVVEAELVGGVQHPQTSVAHIYVYAYSYTHI